MTDFHGVDHHAGLQWQSIKMRSFVCSCVGKIHGPCIGPGCEYTWNGKLRTLCQKSPALLEIYAQPIWNSRHRLQLNFQDRNEISALFHIFLGAEEQVEVGLSALSVRLSGVMAACVSETFRPAVLAAKRVVLRPFLRLYWHISEITLVVPAKFFTAKRFRENALKNILYFDLNWSCTRRVCHKKIALGTSTCWIARINIMTQNAGEKKKRSLATSVHLLPCRCVFAVFPLHPQFFSVQVLARTWFIQKLPACASFQLNVEHWKAASFTPTSLHIQLRSCSSWQHNRWGGCQTTKTGQAQRTVLEHQWLKMRWARLSQRVIFNPFRSAQFIFHLGSFFFFRRVLGQTQGDVLVSIYISASPLNKSARWIMHGKVCVSAKWIDMTKTPDVRK